MAAHAHHTTHPKVNKGADVGVNIFELQLKWTHGWQLTHGTISVWFIRVQMGPNIIHQMPWGQFYQHCSTLIQVWISNYIYHKVRNEIIYPFQNFNGATVEIWECINNFIPHFTGMNYAHDSRFVVFGLGPLLLAWFNFNPSMDK